MSESTNLIITSWNWKDYITFFLLIPSFLILIFLLPQNIKSSLILYTKNPTLLSIFFSNFVHSDLNHIKANLTLYFFITFLIFGVETNKRVFHRSMLVIFTILPIFSSLIEVYFLPFLNTIQGFSAIVSALAGYFLYSTCNYLKKFYEVHEISSFFWLLLMINFTLLTFFYQKLDSFVLTFGITLVFLYKNRTNIRTIFEKIKLKNKDLKKFKFLGRFYRIELFFFSLLFIFSLPFLVPFDIKMGTSVINTPAHYIGYLFGLVTVFIVEKSVIIMMELDIEKVRELAKPLIEKVIPEKKNEIEFRRKLHEDDPIYRAFTHLKNRKFLVDFHPDYWEYNDSKDELKILKKHDKVLQCTILHELCHIKLNHVKEKLPTDNWEKQLFWINKVLPELEADIKAKEIAEELGMIYVPYKKEDLTNFFLSSLNYLPRLIKFMAQINQKNERMKRNTEISEILTRISYVYCKIKE